jgi:hypothetical protein
MRSSERKKTICWTETHKLYAPTEDGSFLVFVLGQGCALQDFQRVWDGNSSVKLSAWHIVVKVLYRVSICLDDETGNSAARTLVYHWMTTSGMPWAVIWSISSDLMRGNTFSNLCFAIAGGMGKTKVGRDLGAFKGRTMFHTLIIYSTTLACRE